MYVYLANPTLKMYNQVMFRIGKMLADAWIDQSPGNTLRGFDTENKRLRQRTADLTLSNARLKIILDRQKRLQETEKRRGIEG